MPGPASPRLRRHGPPAPWRAAGGRPAARLLRALAQHPEYAALGAIGPDLFYFTGPPGLTRAERTIRLLAEAAQPFAELLAAVRRQGTPAVLPVALARETAALGRAALARLGAHLAQDLHERVLAAGQDLFAYLRPAVQDGQPEAAWNWGQLLHYRRTGRFAAVLLDAAAGAGRSALLAYALGYASHHAADALGHGFVNSIVGGPFRLHYHRHHLVELQMDAWAWQARHGDELDTAALAARLDLGPRLPEPLHLLLRRTLAAVYGSDPQPEAPPDLDAAYTLLRRLLVIQGGGRWCHLAPPAAPGLAGSLWCQVHRHYELVRDALVDLGLVYPAAAELEPALYCTPAGPPDTEYPRASIHVPDRPNLASPRRYPPTPRDGLAALLGRDGRRLPGPPWRPSRFAGQAPDVFILPAARTVAAYALGAAIPDLNLDADPVEGMRCWQAVGDLRLAGHALKEL